MGLLFPAEVTVGLFWRELVILLAHWGLQVGLVTATLIISGLKTVDRTPVMPLPGCLTTVPKHAGLSVLAWYVYLLSPSQFPQFDTEHPLRRSERRLLL